MLRRDGKLDEAVDAAERALKLERGAGGESTARVAEALSRLADLHELRGDWGRAVALRNEILGIRGRADGRDHWRTLDAWLARAFAEKADRLPTSDQRRLVTALTQECESRDLLSQQRFEEAERAASKASDVFVELIKPGEGEKVGRVFLMIGMLRTIRGDAAGAA